MVDQERAGGPRLKEKKRQLLGAAAGGALLGLGWLSLGLGPLLPLGFLGAMVGLAEVRTGRQAARFGLVFGAARYIVASHFLLALLRFSPLGILYYFMAVVYILPSSVLEGWGSFRLERATGIPRFFFLPVFYLVLEKLRSLGDLSFPADLLAHSFGPQPAFLGLTPFTGSYGVPLWAGMTGALLFQAWRRRESLPRAAAWAAGGLALFLAPLAADALAGSGTGTTAGRLKVGIVQPSASPEFKLKKELWPEVWASLTSLTRQAARGADLVVWPETARLGHVLIPEQGPFSDPEVEELSRSIGVPILYGCRIGLVRGGREVVALYNAAALVHPDGKPAQWYGKQRLLPFVEGVPFASLFGWDPAQRARSGPRKGYLGMLGNFAPGPEPPLFEVGPARLGVLICYEGFYPQLTRRYRNAGANALVVLTNDMWWGKSVFPGWHSRMVSARARETGLPVLRAANNGISSLTDQRGRAGQRTRTDEVRTLQVELDLGRGENNFYLVAGDWPAWLGLLFLLGAAAAALVRRDRGHSVAA